MQDIALVFAATLAISTLVLLGAPTRLRDPERVRELLFSLSQWVRGTAYPPLESGPAARDLPLAGGTGLPERLSQDVQWARATGIVTDAIARVESVQALQRSAGQQLDSATYALQRLVAELSGVMQMPVAGSPALDRASIHQLSPPAPQRERNEALAA